MAYDQGGGIVKGYGGMYTPPRDPGRGLAGLLNAFGMISDLIGKVLHADGWRLAREVDRQRKL